jgi:hypothetical protein
VIREEREKYEKHPWFAFLRDASVPADYRLAYAPFAAHFIMTFSDINRLMMDGPADDPYTAIVKRHAREDATHWAWYLKDMETLGWNPETTFNDALRFVFRDEGRRTRELGYFMAAMIIPASPQLRYCLIEAIEAMGNAWLNATLVAARQSRHAKKLIYFGGHHLERETGHAIGSEAFQKETLQVTLDDAVRAKAIHDVRVLFSKMSDFNTEILEHSQALLRTGTPPSAFLGRPRAPQRELGPTARAAGRAFRVAEGLIKRVSS